MQMVCDMWEDLQHTFCFEGLVLHVAGTENRLSDKASRCKRENDVPAALLNELAKLGMAEVELKKFEVVWESGDVHVDISDFLLR